MRRDLPNRLALIWSMAITAWMLALPVAGSGQVSLLPAADATLIQARDANSAGGATFFNSGTTQAGTSNRALLRFDVAAAFPSNALVTSANLWLTALRQSITDPQDSVFGLHRVLRPWGEGTNAPEDGLGVLAQTGDATWSHRFAFDPAQAWAAPGGAPGSDYVPAFSSSAYVSSPSAIPYLFESTVDLMGDVQHWVDHPDSNFGWILICESENIYMTAKRFGSREDPSDPPQLLLEYVLRPVLSIALTSTNALVLNFTAEAGQPCRLERASSLSPPDWALWQAIPALPERTPLEFTDPLPPGPRFYRVVPAL